MSKKRSKTPATSKKTARKLEAPKLLSRDSMVDEAMPEAPTVPTVAPVEAMPTMADALIVEAPMLVETVLPSQVVVDRKQIARLAFAKFAARGYVHGHHVEDWLSAEAELRANA